jgi:ribosomal-protein-alanine N-acetyltransferase
VLDASEGPVVRPAKRADLLDVYRIEKRSFAEPWPFGAFERYLDAAAFLVAANGTEVLGYVVGTLTPNHGRDIGHVRDVAVRPEARGEGLGGRLLDRALASLRAAGGTLAKLEVRESNERAIRLYRGVGFEVARRVPRYYGDGEDALLMTLDLAAWDHQRAGAASGRG